MSNLIIPKCKIVLIGDYSVGKKRIMFSFSGQEFTHLHAKYNYRSRIVKVDEENIKLQIWHAWMLSLVASGREYTSIKKKYYNDTHGIMLVYDVTNEKSFENLEYWMSQIKENAPENVVIMLLGNKCDLKRDIEVPTERAEQFAKKYGIKFFEISSKLNINMEEALYSFARDIYPNMKEEVEVLKTLQNECIISIPSQPKKLKTNLKSSCTIF